MKAFSRYTLIALLATASVFGQSTTDPNPQSTFANSILQGLQQLLTSLGCTVDSKPPVITPPPPPPPPPSPTSSISGVWVNEGEDKVAQDELRATNKVENKTGTVLNRAWDGTTIKLTSAKNEVVSFNLVIEAANADAAKVAVKLDTLSGPNGSSLASKPVAGNGVFDWTNRQIELFYARYVQIKGLSFFGYYKGDERQIPVRFQRPNGVGGWLDRPDHDKMYPDALVPLELVPSFTVAKGSNQSIFADIYVPKTAVAGTYTGSVSVTENGTVTKTIPVSLTVQGFSLPDAPSAKTFVDLDALDIVWRYISGPDHHYINWSSDEGKRAVKITDRYYEMLHRHKMGVIGENDCPVSDSPCATSLPRLNGSLFTASNLYDGPGVNTPNDIFSIGTYGTWGAAAYGIPYWKYDQTLFYQHTNNWETWFSKNAPNVEHFLYLADEPSGQGVKDVQMWANWIHNNPGPGRTLTSMSTYPATKALVDMPGVDAPTSPGGIGGCASGVNTCDNTAVTTAAAKSYLTTPGKKFWYYNDGRPGSGTFDTEDDGIGPRTIPWVQMKFGIQRWFYWYANVSSGGDWFANALTWGSYNRFDNSIGWTGDDGTSNGNGLIIYPGTDLGNAQDSYGVDGPIASLRMKSYRRGLQDADYIAIARQIDAAATNTIISAAVPKALWENPAPGGDPSYFNGPISWSSNPDDWEAKRAQLGAIISAGCAKTPSASYCQ